VDEKIKKKEKEERVETKGKNNIVPKVVSKRRSVTYCLCPVSHLSFHSSRFCCQTRSAFTSIIHVDRSSKTIIIIVFSLFSSITSSYCDYRCSNAATNVKAFSFDILSVSVSLNKRSIR